MTGNRRGDLQTVRLLLAVLCAAVSCVGVGMYSVPMAMAVFGAVAALVFLVAFLAGGK